MRHDTWCWYELTYFRRISGIHSWTTNAILCIARQTPLLVLSRCCQLSQDTMSWMARGICSMYHEKWILGAPSVSCHAAFQLLNQTYVHVECADNELVFTDVGWLVVAVGWTLRPPCD